MATNILTMTAYSESAIATGMLAFGAYFLLTGLISTWKAKLHLPSPLLAMCFGIILGPKVLDVLTLGKWVDGEEGDEAREAMLWFCRTVTGIQVLSAAITLPTSHLLSRSPFRSLLTLLVPQITSAWLISATLIYMVIPNISWLESLVVGGCLGPTDPVLASSVIKGIFAENHVPERIRNLLLAEASMNDGAGTPFVYLSLLLLLRSLSPLSPSFDGEESIPRLLFGWVTKVLGYNVIGGALLGLSLGYVFRNALSKCKKWGWMEKEDNLIFTLALAITVIGSASLMEVNELLACFMAGSAINWDDHFHDEDLNTHFTLGIDTLLDNTIFTFVGTILPWDQWLTSTETPFGRLLLLSVLILAFRRLPMVLLLKKGIPEVTTWGETAFVGWFGPMGVAALYYVLTCIDRLPNDAYLNFNLFPIVTFIIASSIIVHGTTIPFLMLSLKVAPSLAPHLLPNGNSNGAVEHDGTLGENAPRYRDEEDE